MLYLGSEDFIVHCFLSFGSARGRIVEEPIVSFPTKEESALLRETGLNLREAPDEFLACGACRFAF